MAASDEIDLELIAAYIDGSVSPAERDRVVALLGSSEAAFEVYAEAIKAQADVATDSVIPFRRRLAERKRFRGWLAAGLPAAAAAALLIAIVPTIRRTMAQPEFVEARAIVAPVLALGPTAPSGSAPMSSGDRQADLRATLRPGWEDHWSAQRGGTSTLVESSAALRLGVRASDLQVALSIGEPDVALQVVDDVMRMLQGVALSELVVHDYAAIRRRIVAHDSLDAILAAASGAEKGLDELLRTPWFAVGVWIGAGEVAARAQSASFFKSRRTLDFLDWATSRAPLPRSDVDVLREIGRLARGELGDRDFEIIARRFAELMARHG